MGLCDKTYEYFHGLIYCMIRVRYIVKLTVKNIVD